MQQARRTRPIKRRSNARPFGGQRGQPRADRPLPTSGAAPPPTRPQRCHGAAQQLRHLQLPQAKHGTAGKHQVDQQVPHQQQQHRRGQHVDVPGVTDAVGQQAGHEGEQQHDGTDPGSPDQRMQAVLQRREFFVQALERQPSALGDEHAGGREFPNRCSGRLTGPRAVGIRPMGAGAVGCFDHLHRGHRQGIGFVQATGRHGRSAGIRPGSSDGAPARSCVTRAPFHAPVLSPRQQDRPETPAVHAPPQPSGWQQRQHRRTP